MKKAIFVFLLLAFAATLCGCKSKDTFDPRTIHNTRLGTDVSLGMDKSDVDELLGNSELNDSSYFYSDSGLSVIYKEGKAVMLITLDNAWESIYKTHVGMKPTDVQELCGAPFPAIDITQCLYAFDATDKTTTDKDDMKTFVVFSVAGDSIDSIVIGAK